MTYNESSRSKTSEYNPAIPTAEISSQPEAAATPEYDTLKFKNQLEYTLYNRQINKDLLSEYVSTSANRIPAEVVDDITKSFYSNLKESDRKSFFEEEPLSINDVQIYETTNRWNIYVITVGSPYETKGYMVGCYNRERKNFILKDAFEDECATFTFKAPKISGKGLEFSVYENYSCDNMQEEIYTNQFAVSVDTVVHERLLVSKNLISSSEKNM